MQIKNDNYLTIKEVAEKTGLTQSNLYTLLHYDRINYEAIGGRVVIPKKVFEEWEKTNITPKNKVDSKKKI